MTNSSPSVKKNILPGSLTISPLPVAVASRSWLFWLALIGLASLLPVIGKQQHKSARAKTAPAMVPLPNGVVAVKVEKTAHGYRLLRGGKPYYLQGGGGLQHYDKLRAAGANTVRLWSTDYATPLLDEAHKQGLTVMLGLWLEPEDDHFTYHDPAMVEAQRRRVRQQVLRFRHHPALLMWSVGNEVEQSAAGPTVFKAINEIARMIHELDPYHPVTTALAHDFVDRANQLQQTAPAVDIMSVNIYGELGKLPQMIKQSKWQGPYIVSEFGCAGYWENAQTPWRRPLEPSSSDKAKSVRVAYRRSILADSTHCLGAYAFYWGAKFEYTATWLSLFEPTGEKTELVDELQRLWRGSYPANRAPRLTALHLPGLVDTLGVQLRPGQCYPATVKVTDPEGDALTAHWEMAAELPSAMLVEEIATPTETVPGCVVQTRGLQAVVRAPQKPGHYRLFVRVFDGHGSVATANIPVLVQGQRPPEVGLYSLLSSSN